MTPCLVGMLAVVGDADGLSVRPRTVSPKSSRSTASDGPDCCGRVILMRGECGDR